LLSARHGCSLLARNNKNRIRADPSWTFRTQAAFRQDLGPIFIASSSGVFVAEDVHLLFVFFFIDQEARKAFFFMAPLRILEIRAFDRF
jgi:hypothetical protein